MKIEAIDWLLFNYPEFQQRSQQTDNEQRGMTEFIPRVNQPKSPVERVVISRGFMYEVAQAIESAVKTLDEYQKEIVHVKYGWRWIGSRVNVYNPTKTTQTYRVLCEQGFTWSEEKFYDDLKIVRERVQSYVGALSRTTLREVSAMMPRKNRFTSEQVEKVFEYINKLQ